MKHYGDITKLNGCELPIVDIITGGSPCQDLSIAGKRAGLDGERSGLFMEQIRVIKEIREHDKSTGRSDEYIRPRFMVWENVSGAFSSNKGEDFRVVLEETAKIADENAVIPGLEGGRWPEAGCIMGDGYSIAWRVHDAQFWGVPQRRKRICLLADFNGDTAPKILFELQPEAVDGDTEQAIGHSGNIARPEIQSVTEGVSGDIEPGKETREEVARVIREDSDTAIYDVRISSDGTKNWRAHAYETDISRNLDTGGATQTVTTEESQSSCLNSWDVQSKHIQPENGIAESLYSGECRYGGGESYVMCLNDQGGSQMEVTENITGTMYTLNTVEQHAVCYAMQRSDELVKSDVVSTQSARQYKGATDLVVYGLDRASFNQGQNAQFDFSVEKEKAQTLVSKGPGGVLAKR